MDLIYRQAAIDECYSVTVDGEVYEVVQVETLMGLPSAQPEPKTGHWVWDKDGMDWDIGAWRCTECHLRPETTWSTMKDINPHNWNGSKYCPNCGAKMEVDK